MTPQAHTDARPFPVEEATNRQMDRMMASASTTRPAQRPGAEPGDPLTIIAAEGRSGQTWYVSFGPVDIEAVINELELGAPCGICHQNPCAWRNDGAES